MEKSLFEELASAGAVSGVSAQGIPGGFVLVAHTPGGDRLLRTQRGQTRVFSSLDTVALFVRGLGLNRFTVDLAGWDRSGLV